MHRMHSAAAIAALVLSSSHAFAGIVAAYDVGTGPFASTIQVDFENGNGYLFTLRWTEPTNGFQALQQAIVTAARTIEESIRAATVDPDAPQPPALQLPWWVP